MHHASAFERCELRNSRNKPLFSASTTGTTLEILIYEEIGVDWWSGQGVTAINVAAAIKAAGAFENIVIRINSPGGDCFEGVTIYNLLRSIKKPIEVFVDGIAASAASVIAMAGDTINIGIGGMLMIHNAAWSVFGDANVLRKAADEIEKVSVTIAEIYVLRTGNDAAVIKQIMDAETWMGAAEAIEKGFATAEVVPEEAVQAQARALINQFNMKGFKHVPAALSARRGARNESVDPACTCPCSPCQTIGCGGCENDPCEYEGCTCPNHVAEMKGEFTPDLEFYRQRLALHERSA